MTKEFLQNNMKKSNKSFLIKWRILIVCCAVLICGILTMSLTKNIRFVDKTRRAFNNSFLAKSSFFHVVLDETNMKDDLAYGDGATSRVTFPLIIDESPDANLSWECAYYTIGGFQCHLKGKDHGYNDLSNYYWEKHEKTIDGFLTEYPCLEVFGYGIRNGCKMDELKGFAQEILTIPDFSYLYQAYKVECDRLGEACENGGKFINGPNTTKNVWLFDWMKENGL